MGSVAVNCYHNETHKWCIVGYMLLGYRAALRSTAGIPDYMSIVIHQPFVSDMNVDWAALRSGLELQVYQYLKSTHRKWVVLATEENLECDWQ